jgi:hypothetical protein
MKIQLIGANLNINQLTFFFVYKFIFHKPFKKTKRTPNNFEITNPREPPYSTTIPFDYLNLNQCSKEVFS